MPGVYALPVSLARLVADLRDDDGLDQAACRGHAQLFDEGPLHGEDLDARDARHRRAVRLCDRCPSRRACAALAASMPVELLDGIWAGRRYTYQPKRAAGAA